MTYCTQTDLIELFGEELLIQLTDRTNTPASAIDEITVAKNLQAAGETVNGYLAKLYKLPLSVVPAMLLKVNADIALYYLYGDRIDDKSPARIAYKDALAWLKDVASGTIRLDAEGMTPAQAGGGQINHSAPDRVFTRGSLRGF